MIPKGSKRVTKAQNVHQGTRITKKHLSSYFRKYKDISEIFDQQSKARNFLIISELKTVQDIAKSSTSGVYTIQNQQRKLEQIQNKFSSTTLSIYFIQMWVTSNKLKKKKIEKLKKKLICLSSHSIT